MAGIDTEPYCSEKNKPQNAPLIQRVRKLMQIMINHLHHLAIHLPGMSNSRLSAPLQQKNNKLTCLPALRMLNYELVFTAALPMVLLLMAKLLKILLSACHTHELFVIAAFVLFLYGLSS